MTHYDLATLRRAGSALSAMPFGDQAFSASC